MVENSPDRHDDSKMLEDIRKYEDDRRCEDDDRPEERPSSTEPPTGSETEGNGDHSTDSGYNSSNGNGKIRNCTDCEYKTIKKANFNRHVRSMHTILDVPLTCCGLFFDTKYGKVKHVKDVHGGGYICDFSGCGKVFKRRATLHRHFTTHTGEKPFLCEDCTYACNNKSNLKRHQKKCKAMLEQLQMRGVKRKIDDVETNEDERYVSTSGEEDFGNSIRHEHCYSLPSAMEESRGNAIKSNGVNNLPTNSIGNVLIKDHVENPSPLNNELSNSTNQASRHDPPHIYYQLPVQTQPLDLCVKNHRRF